ncbi:MAG TPA: pit accessory protein [Verrucomicrobiota bacterium]|jgi:hypothetical protein|nr:pit accessory protein [Verrucomicrobiota bacterium]OQB93395.1 MAG: hypothetical protein BWX84_00590 [Verrucomicrobia bacterium ADurb.Bin118]HPY29060.1 pit accessory protein [Verrucomicrobiota bacterium]HQB16189.1 pit accessory protein [Verrucomicrobiota bacterium]
MFSLQRLFGKDDKFCQLLEAAAMEAHASVHLVIELIKNSHDQQILDDLAVARRKEKKIAEQIGEELVKTFITGLEREDIEALSVALRKIPKTAKKFAQRWQLATRHLEGVDFTRQAELMEQASGVVLTMVQQLRNLQQLEKQRDLNDRLQYVESEADRLMLELLQELYSGKYDALRAIVIRDLYELIEEVVDCCRDAGNIVMHIMLENA